MAEHSPEVDALTRELKSLVRTGAQPHLLLDRLLLRGELAEYRAPDGQSNVARGRGLRNNLEQIIDRVADPERSAFRLLLAFEEPTLSAESRRGRAMKVLGVAYELGTWRGRPHGPEFDLLAKLAQVILDTAPAGDRPAYEIERLVTEYFIRADGVVTKAIWVEEVRAKRGWDGMLKAGWEYPNDPRLDVLQPAVLFGASLARVERPDPARSLVICHFRLPDLRPGAANMFGFTAAVQSNAPMRPYVLAGTQFSPSALRLIVNFERPPTHAWRFSDRTGGIDYQQLSRDDDLEIADSRAVADWPRIKPSKAYGIGWSETKVQLA